MFNTDREIWKAVKSLEGMTLYTYIENSANHIKKVEDNGKNSDRVIIEERNTYPLKGDIIAAYRLLFSNKTLSRNDDLSWLAVPEKKTSSIVFRIIGEITQGESKLYNNKGVYLKLLAT